MSEYNTAPVGWEEIAEEVFSRSGFFLYGFDRHEFRQILRLSDGTETTECLSVYLFFLPDGTGYGISRDYWKEKVRYFRFGCVHKYRGIAPSECRERGISHVGRCYHVSECTECGHIRSVDSSD